jgi:hypothetical protein
VARREAATPVRGQPGTDTPRRHQPAPTPRRWPPPVRRGAGGAPSRAATPTNPRRPPRRGASRWFRVVPPWHGLTSEHSGHAPRGGRRWSSADRQRCQCPGPALAPTRYRKRGRPARSTSPTTSAISPAWSSTHQARATFSAEMTGGCGAKPVLGPAVEGPRVMPCHIALPEISETFGQSGHITHVLAGEAASHTPPVPGARDEVNRARPTRSESRVGRDAAPAEVSVVWHAPLGRPGISLDVMSTMESSL